MARQVSTIQQQTIDNLLADSTTPADITSKKVAKWLVWTHIIAVCIAFFEQILDIFTSEIESRVNKAGVGTPPWMLDRVKEFQYGNAVRFDPATGGWSYPLPSSAALISRVGVTKGANNVINIKVAKSDPPVPIGDGTGGSDDEYTALVTYVNKTFPAGINYNIINQAADIVTISGEVIYDGQFTDSIQTTVVQAIRDLLATLSNEVNFGANLKANDIIKAVLAVPGVIDFKLLEAAGRIYSTAYSSRSVFYELDANINLLQYSPASGYFVEETESENTLFYKIKFKVAQ